jgi:hypothetical protein
MLTFSLISKHNFEDKLKSILDTAKLKEEVGICIMTDRPWHMDIVNFMNSHKAVKRVKLGGNSFYVIKEMRVEIKPIDFYL